MEITYYLAQREIKKRLRRIDRKHREKDREKILKTKREI
jgi:hypothetical protein